MFRKLSQFGRYGPAMISISAMSINEKVFTMVQSYKEDEKVNNIKTNVSRGYSRNKKDSNQAHNGEKE